MRLYEPGITSSITGISPATKGVPETPIEIRLPAKLVAITYTVLGWVPLITNVLDESIVVGFNPLAS